MRSPEECRRAAEEAERAASDVASPKMRDTLLRVAQAWHKLAQTREQEFDDELAA